MIGRIVREILGLFVDDEILAIGIVAVVGLAGMVALTERAGQSIAALVLVIGLPAALIADVVHTVGRSTKKQ